MLNYIHAWACNTRDLLPTEKSISNHCRHCYCCFMHSIAAHIPEQ